MQRRQQLPVWAQELLSELTRPPHFMKYMQQNQPGTSAPTAADTQAGSERPTSPAGSSTTGLATAGDKKRAAADADGTGRQTGATTVGSRPREDVTWVSTAARPVAERTYNLHTEPLTHVPAAVLRQYHWRQANTSPWQTIAKVTTGKGTYALKQTHLSLARIRFLQRALKYAKQRGFERFAPFVLTEKGNPGMVHDGYTYYATEWLQGSPANFALQSHVAQTAFTLAQFHEQTRGFSPTGYRPEAAQPLFQMHQQRLRDLRQLLYTAEGKKQGDEFDEALLRLKPRLLEDAQQSLQLLQQHDCAAFVAQDEAASGLCHLDVIPSNFIYLANQQMAMIDLDLATFAPRALDLAHLLRRSLQASNWQGETAYNCFVQYNAVKSIPKAEYQLVEAMLWFPYRAWRLAHTRYKFFKDAEQLADLRQYQAEDERRHTFLTAYAKQVDDLQAL